MAQTVHYRLIVRRGPQPNQVFELTADSIMLGRDIINDVTIGDPEVSRQHCRFEKLPEGGYTIEDLGSTNGSFINGTKISGKHNLSSGDKISFGETVAVDYAVTAIDIPTQSRALIEDETRPMESITSTPSAKTGATPTAKAEPQSAPAAYVYTPAQVTETTPEAKRMTLFACGLLTTFCFIGVFMGIILIDAADRWGDVPLIGDLVESSDVAVITYGTSQFEVDAPEGWNVGLLDFSDQIMWIAAPAEIESGTILDSSVGLPQNEPTITILVSERDGDPAGILSVTKDNVLAGRTAEKETLSDRKVAGEQAQVVDLEYLTVAPNNTILDQRYFVRIVTFKNGKISYTFVGISPDENHGKNLDIFDQMLDSFTLKK